ncbi:MAG: hypothetical protein ABI520_09870 [Caldimonas sp.]
MNDAERDAWLREALRHAPDSDALPPAGVSEAILAKARAAARIVAPTPRRGTSRSAPSNALADLWAWLARPPVAAGFASVMAATLVGLMWWDRPMDEAMPRAPAPTRAEDAARPPVASPTPETVAPPAAPPATTPEQKVAPDAKVIDPGPAPARRSVESLAKEHASKAAAKNEAPTPFPSKEMLRDAPAERQSPGSAATDAAKKDVNADRSRAADALARAPDRPSTQPGAPPPLAGGRLRADEGRTAAPTDSETAKSKSLGGAASPAPATAPSPALAPLPAPARDNAAAAPLDDRLKRQRAISELREKEGAGFASSVPAPSVTTATPFRQEPERTRPEAAAQAGAMKPAGAATQTVPLARILAAIAAEPERWSRQTATGQTVALDADWRAWLVELDAAAAGRWRPLAVGAAAGVAANDSATTVRLVAAGRVAAIVRIDGSSAEVDASPGTGSDRWLADLASAPAERLRSTARRLAP